MDQMDLEKQSCTTDDKFKWLSSETIWGWILVKLVQYGNTMESCLQRPKFSFIPLSHRRTEFLPKNQEREVLYS
jgi:hypothetical protein